MKNPPAKPAGYETKPDNYFEHARFEMLPYVPTTCQRVLDVGCGQGNFGEALKQSRKVEVWGLEPVASAVAEAATKLDRAIEGIFTPDVDLPPASFDAIIFNDVLEHMPEPTEALQFAHKLLTPGGVIIASIPNIRQFQKVWELAVLGEWQYHDRGILDRTHLKFFTRKSIQAMFTESGYQLDTLQGINAYSGGDGTGKPSRWRIFKVINALTLNAIEDMKYLQFAVVARSPKKS
jgi:2-polyprenyl-3-methyl-5-hydroxy-6-metoxy-1,4-benzoquinol methylase